MTDEEVAAVVGKLSSICERLDAAAASLRELHERVDQLPAEIAVSTRREVRALVRGDATTADFTVQQPEPAHEASRLRQWAALAIGWLGAHWGRLLTLALALLGWTLAAAHALKHC